MLQDRGLPEALVCLCPFLRFCSAACSKQERSPRFARVIRNQSVVFLSSHPIQESKNPWNCGDATRYKQGQNQKEQQKRQPHTTTRNHGLPHAKTHKNQTNTPRRISTKQGRCRFLMFFFSLCSATQSNRVAVYRFALKSGALRLLRQNPYQFYGQLMFWEHPDVSRVCVGLCFDTRRLLIFLFAVRHLFWWWSVAQGK